MRNMNKVSNSCKTGLKGYDFLGDLMYLGLFFKQKLCKGYYFLKSYVLKGCGMGTLFVLVSPCFRENVVVTCKIGSFLCSLDNLLQINVIVFFFGDHISKWRSFEKRAIFLPTFHIF